MNNPPSARVIKHPSGTHTEVPAPSDAARTGGAVCGHHGCLAPGQPPVLNLPTLITLARVAASTLLYLLALVHEFLPLAFVGLAVSWLGDIADGLVARLRHEETRAGAVWDRISDNLSCVLFYMVVAALRHDLVLPIGLYLIEFAVIDTYLSLAFLDWPLLSPNYFYLVDRLAFRLNWTPVAKSLHSTSLLVVLFAGPSVAWATALVALMAAVKIYSIARLQRLPRRLDGGCSVPVPRALATGAAEIDPPAWTATRSA